MREKTMKKILGVSIAAMLAVTPMLASAAQGDLELANSYTAPTHTDSAAPTTNAIPNYGAVTINQSEQSHIASTAYVKGAYNSAIAAVNKTYDTLNTAIGGKQATLSEGNGIDINSNTVSVDNGVGLEFGTAATNDAGKLKVKLDGTTLAVGADGLKVNAITTAQIAGATLVTSSEGIGDLTGDGPLAADTEIPTAKAVRSAIGDAITAAGGQTESQVKTLIGNSAKNGLTGNASNGTLALNLTEKGGLQFDTTNTDGSKTLEVVVDGTTITKDSSTGALKVNSISTSQIAAASMQQGTDGYASSTALTSKGYVDQTVASATTGMATQTGVNKTIESSYVTLYTDWAHPTYTNNVGIHAAAYTTDGTAIQQA